MKMHSRNLRSWRISVIVNCGGEDNIYYENLKVILDFYINLLNFFIKYCVSGVSEFADG